MKTRNLLLGLLGLMMIALAGASISACGDDKEEGSGGSGISGTWTGVIENMSLTVTFKSDYTGIWVTKRESSYYGTQTENGTFTYSLSGSNKGMVIIKMGNDSYYSYYYGSSSRVYTFTIDGNSMKLYENDSLVTTLTKSGGSPTNGGDNVNLSGTWSGVEEGGKDQLIISINGDGTGTYVLKDYSSYYYTYDTSAGSLTYVMEGDSKGMVVIKINSSYYTDRTIVYYFVIQGNQMYVYEDGYGDDLEWVLTKQ